MIEGKSVLAVIPARGGSKGVPGKNVREVAGKPLIAWTIEEARRSSYLDCIIVSTDDQKIAAVAERYGCEVPFLRPGELALDDTPGVAPVLHAVETLPEKYSIVVLLQPTSPLRSSADIDGCLERMMASGAASCVSVVAPQKSPYWMYRVDQAGIMTPLLPGQWDRRQDLPPVFALNGAVYVADTQWLLRGGALVTEETVAYEMPQERSLDIDNEHDLVCCQALLSMPKSER